MKSSGRSATSGTRTLIAPIAISLALGAVFVAPALCAHLTGLGYAAADGVAEKSGRLTRELIIDASIAPAP